ncbi:MAG: prenyltransferase [Elusimicrobia bacterium]|nr:prenyltransferase [Elusimicrobiota bacterium]
MAKHFRNALRDLFRLIRYRFLLFAGLLPYCLGAAIAYRSVSTFDLRLFLTGLIGIVFTLVGVEAFNEYFDWVLGTDRVFQQDPKPVTKKKLHIGIAAFAVALLFAVYLTSRVGAGIFIFAAAGFVAAAGYLGPPLRFAYRGFGEVVIALSYGPAMVLGSYYLQTGQAALLPAVVSAIPAIFLFLIAIINEVPDFLQDNLVGKRNICVRNGRERTVAIYGLMSVVLYITLALMASAGLLPGACLLILLTLPLMRRNYSIARAKLDAPQELSGAIRGTLIIYVVSMCVLIGSFIAPS